MAASAALRLGPETVAVRAVLGERSSCARIQAAALRAHDASTLSPAVAARRLRWSD